MKDEESKKMLAEFAGDYYQLSMTPDTLVTQQDRDEEEANRLRRQQATGSLAATDGSDVRFEVLPVERKCVEPMAAITAPARVSAQHQSRLHFVNQGLAG
jgi:hypothetical protein